MISTYRSTAHVFEQVYGATLMAQIERLNTENLIFLSRGIFWGDVFSGQRYHLGIQYLVCCSVPSILAFRSCKRCGELFPKLKHPKR